MEDSGIDSGDTKMSTVVHPTKEDTFTNRLYSGSDSSCEESPEDVSPRSVNGGVKRSAVTPGVNSIHAESRTLQRKLELRMQRSKRTHAQQKTRMEEYNKPSPGSGLIPIQRLSIPGAAEQQPLVQWETDEDSDEDVVSFFPLSRSHTLSDTFSLQDYSPDAMDVAAPADDLGLLPPNATQKPNLVCCAKCTVM